MSKEGTVARSRLVRTSVKSRRLHSQRQYRSRSKERLVPTKQSLPTSLAHSHTTTVKQNEDSTREGSKEESKPAAATKTENGAQQQHSPIPKNKKILTQAGVSAEGRKDDQMKNWNIYTTAYCYVV